MSKQFMVAIYDRALGAFLRPFCAPSEAIAIRGFQDEINRVDSELNKHPGDYELHRLASWDDESGEFQNDKAMLILGKQVFLNKGE